MHAYMETIPRMTGDVHTCFTIEPQKIIAEIATHKISAVPSPRNPFKTDDEGPLRSTKHTLLLLTPSLSLCSRIYTAAVYHVFVGYHLKIVLKIR
jgi:hypothetical protein